VRNLPGRAEKSEAPCEGHETAIHVDTSALVDALTGPRQSLDARISLTGEGHRLMLSTIVLYEWLRGPRTRAELAAQRDCRF
jgi:predicted nucleic acid-binding protein